MDASQHSDKWGDVNKTEWCCQKKNIGCTVTSTTITFSTTITTTSTTAEPHFELHPGINCYWRYGADALPHKNMLDDGAPFDVDKCLEACKEEALCEGIIIRSGKVVPEVVNKSHCWLRMNIRPDECFPNKAYNLWLKTAEGTNESHKWGLNASTSSTTTTEEPYRMDCKEEVGDWVHKWSAYKKQYCCKTQGFPCIAVAGRRMDKDEFVGGKEEEKEYDCSALRPKRYDCALNAGWVTTWSTEKKTWCCSHNRVWCPASMQVSTTASPELVQPPVSEEQKQWCCEHEAIGCDHPHEEEYVGRFDRHSSRARAGLANAGAPRRGATTTAKAALGLAAASAASLAAGLLGLAGARRLAPWAMARQGRGAAGDAMIRPQSQYEMVDSNVVPGAARSSLGATELAEQG
jgi:hypothetical protein